MRKVVLIIGLLLVMQAAWVPASYAGPPTAAGFWHTVRWGETLFSMGREFGVNPYSICSANGLHDCDYVWAGQSLWIPAGYDGYGKPGWDGYGKPGQDGYGQPGRDGYGQPGRDGYGQPGWDGYGQPVGYGQPGWDGGYGQPGRDGYGQPGWDGGYGRCNRDYTVRWGDTLYSIGRMHGVGAWQLAAANGIYNLNMIYAGQCLCIPEGRY
jgi:LysM repeat protein